MSVKNRTVITLEEFADSKSSNDISYYSMSLLEKTTDGGQTIEHSVFNVVSDYVNEMKAMTKVVELSDKEYQKYRFRPKMLANYLYGNTELYFIILWLNDMWSVKDFDCRKVNLISSKDLSDVLSKINASEKKFIRSYNESASLTS